MLTHGEETETAPAAQGGTGKTQLAVEFTRTLRNDRAVDVLVWVAAATWEALVSGFAQAAAQPVRVHHGDGPGQADLAWAGLADCERLLGPGDTETLTTRASLASALYAGGWRLEAVAALRRALADSEHYLGADHPMTKTVRVNLGAATQT